MDQKRKEVVDIAVFACGFRVIGSVVGRMLDTLSGR